MPPIRWASLRRRLLLAAGLAVGGLVTLSALLYLGGFDVGRSLGALWSGAVGSSDAVMSGTLVRATPVLLAGVGVALAFRAGTWNLGADGQLLTGAVAATAVASLPLDSLGLGRPAACLLAAAVAGALWASIPAWLRTRFGVLEVVSTIMMNFLAVQLVSYLVRGPMQEPTRIYPQSATLDSGARLPLWPGTRLHAGYALALGGAILTAYVLRYRASGFRIDAIGANEQAAAMAGRIHVSRTRWRVFLASGALAGVAGGTEVLGVTYALYENLSPGYGYTAIAAALLAGLEPAWIIASSALLGGLDAGAAAMQREAGVPAGAAAVIGALLVLILLAGQALLQRDASSVGRLTRKGHRGRSATA